MQSEKRYEFKTVPETSKAKSLRRLLDAMEETEQALKQAGKSEMLWVVFDALQSYIGDVWREASPERFEKPSSK